jgi:hypothetical protein
MNKESPKHSIAAQKFWHAFQACVEENRVRPDRSLFYVKWAKAYVTFLPGKRLGDRSRQDIEAFLADLGKRPGFEDWQIRQAEHALKILYEVFLPSYAPEGTIKPAPETEEKKRITPKAGAFRDRVVPGEVERLFSPLLNKLQTEIRSRHYSIRTERSYLDWVRRFIAFQGGISPGWPMYRKDEDRSGC